MHDSIKQLEKKFYHLLSEDTQMQEFLEEDANAGIWFWDLQNRSNIWLNKSLKKLLGFENDSPISESWLGLVAIDDYKNMINVFDQNIASANNGTFKIDIPFLNNQQLITVVNCRALVLKGNSFLLGLVQSPLKGFENKRLEEELNSIHKLVLKDNALLKSIINSPEDIYIVSIDKEYRYTSFSPKYQNFVKEKFNKDIYVGFRVLDIFSEEQMKLFKPAMDSALRGENCKLIVGLETANGEFSYVENTYNSIWDNAGNVIGSTVFIRDITKSKNAENANRISELRYTSLFTGAIDAIFIANTKTGFIVDANIKACELMGYDKSEIIGMHQTQMHPLEDLEEFASKFKAFAAKSEQSGELNTIETFVLTKDKKRVPVLITAGRSFQIGDETFIAAYFKDITKDKEAQVHTANLLELLKTAEMVSNTGSVEFDLIEKRVIWSDEFYKILGYEPQSFEPDNDSLYNHIHSEDRDEFVHWQELAMTTIGFSDPIELRIIKNDGKIAAIRTSGICFADEQGKIFKFIAVAKDNTIRNRISQELHKQNQQLKEIAWTQSHVVRAPLTRLMGLVHVLQKGIVDESEKETYFKYVLDSAHELDSVVKEITAKTVA